MRLAPRLGSCSLVLGLLLHAPLSAQWKEESEASDASKVADLYIGREMEAGQKGVDDSKSSLSRGAEEAAAAVSDFNAAKGGDVKALARSFGRVAGLLGMDVSAPPPKPPCDLNQASCRWSGKITRRLHLAWRDLVHPSGAAWAPADLLSMEGRWDLHPTDPDYLADPARQKAKTAAKLEYWFEDHVRRLTQADPEAQRIVDQAASRLVDQVTEGLTYRDRNRPRLEIAVKTLVAKLDSNGVRDDLSDMLDWADEVAFAEAARNALAELQQDPVTPWDPPYPPWNTRFDAMRDRLYEALQAKMRARKCTLGDRTRFGARQSCDAIDRAWAERTILERARARLAPNAEEAAEEAKALAALEAKARARAEAAARARQEAAEAAERAKRRAREKAREDWRRANADALAARAERLRRDQVGVIGSGDLARDRKALEEYRDLLRREFPIARRLEGYGTAPGTQVQLARDGESVDGWVERMSKPLADRLAQLEAQDTERTARRRAALGPALEIQARLERERAEADAAVEAVLAELREAAGKGERITALREKLHGALMARLRVDRELAALRERIQAVEALVDAGGQETYPASAFEEVVRKASPSRSVQYYDTRDELAELMKEANAAFAAAQKAEREAEAAAKRRAASAEVDDYIARIEAQLAEAEGERKAAAAEVEGVVASLETQRTTRQMIAQGLLDGSQKPRDYYRDGVPDTFHTRALEGAHRKVARLRAKLAAARSARRRTSLDAPNPLYTIARVAEAAERDHDFDPSAYRAWIDEMDSRARAAQEQLSAYAEEDWAEEGERLRRLAKNSEEEAAAARKKAREAWMALFEAGKKSPSEQALRDEMWAEFDATYSGDMIARRDFADQVDLAVIELRRRTEKENAPLYEKAKEADRALERALARQEAHEGAVQAYESRDRRLPDPKTASSVQAARNAIADGEARRLSDARRGKDDVVAAERAAFLNDLAMEQLRIDERKRSKELAERNAAFVAEQEAKRKQQAEERERAEAAKKARQLSARQRLAEYQALRRVRDGGGSWGDYEEAVRVATRQVEDLEAEFENATDPSMAQLGTLKGKAGRLAERVTRIQEALRQAGEDPAPPPGLVARLERALQDLQTRLGALAMKIDQHPEMVMARLQAGLKTNPPKIDMRDALDSLIRRDGGTPPPRKEERVPPRQRRPRYAPDPVATNQPPGGLPFGGGTAGFAPPSDPVRNSLFGTSGIFMSLNPRTRWEVAKDRLKEFLRGYTNKDVFHCMDQIAKTSRPERINIENALLSDFQQENDINLDLVLLSYNQGLENLCAQVQWNRNAFQVATGTTQVQRGQIQVCFDREDEMRMDRFLGFPPFGLKDPQIRKEAAAGQPNQDPRHDLPDTEQFNGGSGGGGTSGGADTPSGPFTFTTNLSNTGVGDPTDNSVAIDVETNAARNVAVGFANDSDANAGEDVLLSWNGGNVVVNVVAPATAVNCGASPTAATQITSVQDGSLGSATFEAQNPAFGGNGPVVAIKTSSGTYALFDMPSKTSIRMYKDDDASFFDGGSQTCP